MSDPKDFDVDPLQGEGMDKLRGDLDEYFKEGAIKRFFKKLFKKQ